jgi:hypothetical protein
MKAFEVRDAWKVFYDTFSARTSVQTAVSVFRDRFVRCEAAKSIKREHVRIAEIFRLQSNSRKRQISRLSRLFRTSCVKAARKTMSFATKRRTRNQSYLFRVFVAERKILFAIAVNSCCEFDVIWAFSYDRRRDAFDFSNCVLRFRSDEKRSRMNLLLYESRNVRFEKNFASVVQLNVDSRAYYIFVDVMKTICEEFLQWFVASIAKHVECVCRERFVEFAFWLRVVFAEYDFVEYEKIVNELSSVRKRSSMRSQRWQFADRERIELWHESRTAFKKNQQTRMNANQLHCFNTIVAIVELNSHNAHFFVQKFANTDKIFLYRTLCYHFRARDEIVICVVSLNIATLLLSDDQTSHSRFKISLQITNETICNIIRNTHLYEFLRRTKLIIWNKISM